MESFEDTKMSWTKIESPSSFLLGVVVGGSLMFVISLVYIGLLT
jgi:hypothetical protein